MTEQRVEVKAMSVYAHKNCALRSSDPRKFFDKEKMMKNRVSLSVVLVSGLAIGMMLIPAQAQAQSPDVSSPPNLEAKIERMQSQINSLQAQVKHLQSQLRAASPSAAVSPVYPVPSFNAPSFNVPNFGAPNQRIEQPRRYSNIPDCQITLLKQAR